MKILNKYLFLSFVKNSIFVLLGLVLLFSFFQYLEEVDDIGKHNYSHDAAINYIIFSIPSYANSLAILSLMIGIVFTIGQLNSNKELQIFELASFSTNKIVLTVAKYSFLMSLIVIIFLEIITPFSYQISRQIKDQAFGINTNYDEKDIWIKRDNKFFFLKRGDKNNSLKVFEIEDYRNIKSFLMSNKVVISDIGLSSKENFNLRFDSMDNFLVPSEFTNKENYTIEIDTKDILLSNKEVKSMSINELVSTILFSNKNEINISENLYELISRLIRPITLVGMLLMAIPFVLNSRRDVSIGQRIFIAISIGILTHMLNKITSVVSMKFETISYFGAFLPTLLLVSFGLYLLRARLFRQF